MHIYLFRHGQSESNFQQVLQGSLNSPLTKLGEKQAKSLRDIAPKFDTIYSSPLQRAHDTAKLATQRSDILTDRRLQEIHLGELEGLPFTDARIDENVRLPFITLQDDTPFVKYGIERISEFIDRTKTVFDEIVSNAKNENDENIAIFCHGGVLRALLANYLEVIPVEDAFFKNTEMIQLYLSDNDYILKQRKCPTQTTITKQ